MRKHLFTAVHSHRHGTSHYVFTKELTDEEAKSQVPPDEESVIAMFEIDYEPDKEETIDIEYQCPVEEIPHMINTSGPMPPSFQL